MENQKIEPMEEPDIEPGDLVLIRKMNADFPLPRLGLVLKKMPSGESFDIQTGTARKERDYYRRDDLLFVMKSQGRYKSPQEAFEAHTYELFALIAYVALTNRDWRTLIRYKRMVQKHGRTTLRRWLSRLLRRID